MPAKLTIETVREGFLNRGLTLLETDYVDSGTPMRYRCAVDHEGKLRWCHVQQGKGCARCASKKLMIEEVRKGFLNRGFS